MSGSASKLKKRRRPSVSPLTTKAEIEAHKSLERWRKQEPDSREKKVSVVISKDGEEPLSQKELYKKKIAKHIEKRKANGGESPADSPELVSKNRPKRAKLKLLVTQSEPKNDLLVDKENANEDTNTSKSKKRELSEERIPSPKKEFRPFNADLFDENKYDMPNSQLPVPGREAYWDMDTPETKKSGHFIWCLITPSIPRFRESLYSTDSLLEEPELHLDASPTLDAKLKLKPRRRLEQVSENKVKVEESALEKAMRLCKEVEEEEERERLKEEEVMQKLRIGEVEEMENGEIVEESTRAETEHTTMTEKRDEDKKLDSEEAIFNVSTEPIERDMFEDTPEKQDHNNEKEVIDLNCSNIVKQIDFEALDTKEDDGFDEDLDDGQDSFLVAASQMVEAPVVEKEVNTTVKKELIEMEKDNKATAFKLKKETKPLLPLAVVRLQQMGESDGFGSDDSFDEQMSQLPPGGFGTPASPVLKKRHQSPRTSSRASSMSPALSTRSRSTVLPPLGHPKPPNPACALSSLTGVHPKVIGNVIETIKPSDPASAALKPPVKPSGGSQEKQQYTVKPDQNKQSSQPGWKRFSSFDQKASQSSSSSSGNGSDISTSTGSSFKRVKSSPVVSQLRSQEEIDRKRKEAMAKREEAGRRRIKSEEEAERKKRKEAEKRLGEVEADKKKAEEVEKRKEEGARKRRDEMEKYNSSVMRETEENKKKELKMKEEEALRIKEAKDKEEAVKKMKEEIERKKREAKERLARSRSQQSQQQGVKIDSQSSGF